MSTDRINVYCTRKKIPLTASCFSWFYALLASGMTLVWKGNQGNIIVTRSPSSSLLEHPEEESSRPHGSPHYGETTSHQTQVMAGRCHLLQGPRDTYQIPSCQSLSYTSQLPMLQATGQSDLWRTDQLHPVGWIAAGCCSADVCDTGHWGQGEGGERAGKAKQPACIFPVLCSACETWQHDYIGAGCDNTGTAGRLKRVTHLPSPWAWDLVCWELLWFLVKSNAQRRLGGFENL